MGNVFVFNKGKEEYQLKQYVYQLEHKNDKCSMKLLGFFSSYKLAMEAIKPYLSQSGFKDYPDDFWIYKCRVRGPRVVPLQEVFLLSHEYEEGEYNIYHLWGPYSVESIAQKALMQKRRLKAFCPYPDGFVIDCYTLNEREWKEGFVPC